MARTVLFKAIDVSKYQGKIDWPKVKASGITGAWIRVGWAGYDGEIYWQNGSVGCDPDFHYNMQGATAAGLDVGVYVYSYVKTPDVARLAIKNAVKHCGKYKMTLPFAWDYEEGSQYGSYGKTLNTEICAAALDEIKAYGYYPMLYTYTNFANPYLNMGELSRYDFWQADYRAQAGALPGYKGTVGAWQYTSSGAVNGITGRVDMNEVYVDYPAIIAGKEPSKPTGTAGMLFWHDNRVEYQYCVYGPASGRTHNGIDVDTTSSDKRVLSPVAGKVVSSTIITDKNNLTWEWGNYVCVLDSAGRKHYFCHLASRSVAVGAMVVVGQEIGIMGMTGNAAYDKQKEHVHYEVRVSPYGSANHIDPTPFCKIPNKVGTTWNHKETPEQEFDRMLLKSFGTKNMQGFNFPDANSPVAYDKMPNGYRIVTERSVKGTDGEWEWVKLLDERTGADLYTPLLSDRNQLLDDVPALLPPGGNDTSTDAILTAKVALANSQHITENIKQLLSELGVV